MMTVAACVLPTEVPAVIAPNQANNPAGDNPIADQQAIANQTGDRQKDRNQEDDNQKQGKRGDRSGEIGPVGGTTVQLPTFTHINVVTTVSVPDGGTVLLSGIKRLQEGRTETGVPLLSKIPYINRIFRNHGIGEETSRLMMMVTPRIIIQEEE